MITTKQALETNLSVIRKLAPRKGDTFKRLVTIQNSEMYYTNGDTFLTLPLPCLGETVEVTTVNIDDLTKCLKSLGKGTVELSRGNEGLVIEQGGMVYTIFTHSEEIPSPPENTYSKQNIPQNVLERAFTCTHAAAEDDPRIFLEGALFEPLDASLNAGDEHGLRVVATDGHRLVLVDSTYSQDVAVTKSFIVGKETLVILELLAKKGFGYHYFGTALKAVDYSQDNWLKISGDFTLITRLVNAEYPDYNMVIPQRSEHTFTLTKDFLKYLTAKNSTKFTFTPGNIHLANQGFDGPCFNHNVPNDTVDFAAEVGLQTHYVMDAIRHAPTDTVTVKYDNELNPIVFEAPGYKAVVMPVRLR